MTKKQREQLTALALKWRRIARVCDMTENQDRFALGQGMAYDKCSQEIEDILQGVRAS
jgi:hypothetical protein